MSDRLKDLQRQRALAQEQLAWLDREIARETGGQPPASAAPATPQAAVTPRPLVPPPAADADAIIAQYQGQGRSVHDDVKRGCFIYFFAALTLLVLGLTAFWFLRYR